MTQRSCVHVTTYRDVYGGVTPNAFIPSVTVDLRVFFPPFPVNVPAAIDALNEAHNEARQQLFAYQEGQHE